MERAYILDEEEAAALLEATQEARNIVQQFVPEVRKKYEAMPMFQACRKLETPEGARRIHALLDQMDWYRRCLEDIQHGHRVTGLQEAKLGYDRAHEELRELAGDEG